MAYVHYLIILFWMRVAAHLFAHHIFFATSHIRAQNLSFRMKNSLAHIHAQTYEIIHGLR